MLVVLIQTEPVMHLSSRPFEIGIKKACAPQVSGAHLWHIVLLMTVVFNMPFGPWSSHAWYNEMREMCRDRKTMTPPNALFEALYHCSVQTSV